MRSIVAPSTRLLAGGLILAAAVADIGAAVAEPRRSRGGATVIEELGAPNGRGFDDIIVKLAPLVASKPERAVRAAERPAPTAAPESPTVAVAAAPPPPTETAKPAPAAPVFLREPLPIIESAPPVEAVAKAPQPAVAPEAAIETKAESTPVESTPVESTAEQSPVATPEATEAEAEPPKTEAPVVAEAAPESRAEAMTAPRTEEASPQDESESPLALWQALVAAAALSGLLAMKYVKRAPAAAKAAEPAPAKTAAAASETTPSGRFAMLLAVVRTRIEPLRAKIAALRPSKAAERPAQPPAPKDAPAKPKTLDWTDVATVLRARFGGAKAAGERSAAASNHVIALVESEGRGRMSDSWETSDEDGPELLEPGDASARTIVMNARRRLRSAQS
ncbi:hypothetical+protein [Methylocapsa aurea]|uniref:hypothetical protein n=1 Tax=Methylocapsa aurea TaxID=663610 RepID=UPI003D18D62A